MAELTEQKSTEVVAASSSSSSLTGSAPSVGVGVGPSSSPSSFFTASISSTDSAYHRIAVLLCPGCRYLEFPGCLVHNGLLANIKGNGYMSCVACELDRKAKGSSDVPGGADNMLSMVCATDSAEPWSVACQHCNAVKADTIPWILADKESVALAASMAYEKEDVMPHTVIQCEQCKTATFPMVGQRLTRRHPVDPARAIFHPDEPDKGLAIADFPFQHYVADCHGALIPIPILISKLEGKFCGQALPASPYLPLDSSFVPGFIPPLEWVTGEAHKQQLRQAEWRKEKYILAGIGHRTPVWRDKAYIGVFGDPYVRDTELEGGHIAESIDAMHFVLDALYRSSAPSSTASRDPPLPFSFSTADWFSMFTDGASRSAMKRVIDTIEGSLDTIHLAKDALDALADKDMKDSEKLRFTYRLMRNWRKKVRAMQVGDVLLLPGGWIAPKAGHAIMHILYRYEHSYSFVTCNTGGGLTYHPSSVKEDGSKTVFRTSIRLDQIRPDAMLDDAFWLLFWRLQTVQSDDHDHHVLYEILLPTLGEKPLAEALTESDPHAEWRTPQRAGNCFPEADHRVLTDHGFLFLDEIEERLRRKQTVRYAAYDRASQQIVYCAGELFIRDAASHDIIDWTPAHDHSWTTDSDQYGRHPKHAPADANHFSIRVTPDHQVYGRTGVRQAGSATVEWASRHMIKVATSELVSSDSTGEFQHLAIAEHGVRREHDDGRRLVDELAGHLGLTQANQIDAFLEIYDEKATQQWLTERFQRVGLTSADIAIREGAYRIHSRRWVNFFRNEYDQEMSSALSDEDTALAASVVQSGGKWLFSWVLKRCSKQQLRLLIGGLRRADGARTQNEQRICTSSIRLRDELMVALLQAGYTAHFSLAYPSGAISSQDKERNPISPERYDALPKNQQANCLPTIATAACWSVCYAEPTSRVGRVLSRPVVNRSCDMQRTTYVGRVWCVTVAHADHLIVAQRAHRTAKGVVTKASRPVVISNCYLKCVLECVRYLSRSFGMTKAQTKQCAFNVRRMWMNLCREDMRAHEKALKDHPDSGDDQARRKREAARLKDKMKEEGVPERKEKKAKVEPTLVAVPVGGASNPDAASTALNPHSLSTVASVEEANEGVSLPLVDIPAEEISVDSTPLHDESDLTMIRLSTKQTAHAAIKEAKSGRLSASGLKAVWNEIDAIEHAMLVLPLHVHTSSHIQPQLQMGTIQESTFSLDSPSSSRTLALTRSTSLEQPGIDVSTLPSPFTFPGWDTFPLSLEEETQRRLREFAGQSDPLYEKKLTDFRGVFRPIDRLEDILAIFQAALQLCENIDAPKVDSLNGYYQILSLIQGVLTTVPLPGSSLANARAWHSRRLKSLEQVHLVRTLWRLGRFYMSAELSVESPAFVSGVERTVCMWALVTIADWALRSGVEDIAQPSITCVLNGGDGGGEANPFYMVDLRNGGGSHVREMIRSMTISSPALAQLYGELVEYWNELETTASMAGLKVQHILPFLNSAPHQTAMFLEDDSTLNFVRDIARHAGYVIEQRGYAGKESSEIEAVARWCFAVEESDYSIGSASFGALIPQLARDHPEWCNFRDLHFLFKLALVHTHPTSRVVLPGRYTERDASIHWTTQGMPMSNSMVILYAKAFSKKEIILIKTRAIDSYATPDAYLPALAKGSASNQHDGMSSMGGLMGLMGGMGGGFGGFGGGGFGQGLLGLGGAGGGGNKHDWTEEDIIHNTQPALFGNLLSLQSSEHIMCILTAPYLRIPLLLAFFSNRDRVDLLAERQLGRLLEHVLFEAGEWASRFHEEDIEEIPFAAAAPAPTTSASGSSAPSQDGTGRKARIGSPHGLLLNELCQSAGATLNPFLTLLTHALALDTGYFSVSSSTCRLILYAARLAVKMEAFVRYTVEQVTTGSLKSASPLNTSFLKQAHTDLLYLLHGPILSVLLSYKTQAMQVISEAVWVMASIALVSTSGLTVPSYVKELQPSLSLSSLLAPSSARRFSPSSPFSPSSMVSLLGSFSFVLTWHSMGIGIGKNLEDDEAEGNWNKSTSGASAASGMDMMAQFAETMQASMNASKLKKLKKDDPKEQEKAQKQPIDERQLFQALQAHRGAVLAWFETEGKEERIVNEVFDAIVEWVHGHKMADVEVEPTAAAGESGATRKSSTSFNPQLTAKKPDLSLAGRSHWQPFASSGQVVPGRFVSAVRRLEIDLQTASITFYDHDVFPIHDLVARHEDFLSVFGTEPQHYALISSKEHMQEYGIFGSGYTLQWWDRNLAGDCVNQPAPSKHGSNYNLHFPASKESALPEGKWKCGAKGCAFINPFSALRCELCQAYQPMLSAIEKHGIEFAGQRFTRRYGSTFLAPEETWMVEMMEPLLRTLFGDELDTLNYSLWMREELWTDQDDKVCLFALDAQTFKQIVLHRSTRLLECYNLLEHGRLLYRSLTYTSNNRLSLGGLPTDEALVRMKPWEQIDRFAGGAWEEVQKKVMSFTMKRVRQLTATMSVKESFISPPLLSGLLPKVLVDHFHFYTVDEVIRHPQPGDAGAANHSTGEDAQFAWFGRGDILGFLQKPYRAQTQWNFDLHIKLVPNGRSGGAKEEEKEMKNNATNASVWDKYHAIVSQVTRGAAGSLSNGSFGLTPGSSPSPSPSASPALSPESPTASPDASPAPSGVESGNAPFKGVLLNLMTAAPESFLARLASVLVRVEDLSAILVWSKANSRLEAQRDRRLGCAEPNANAARGDYRITRVDLPRLKLSFRPRQVTLADGTTLWRLFSNDHAGFYISDTFSPALDQLLRGIPNSLLLENDRKELWLVVPNTPLKRPQILSCPFSNELVANRGDVQWLSTISNRFYVYTVHVSHTFLQSATLSSTFYLLLLSLLTRNYIACAQYCETCEIDTGLSSEERFVFQLFEQTLHDQHPDAHAIRLKLYLCIWLSGEPIGWRTQMGEPWSLEDEYTNYLKKLMHVSAACRLTNEEEEALYQQISYEEGQKKDEAPNEQQNRAAIRRAMVQTNSAASGASSSSSSSSVASSVSSASSSVAVAPVSLSFKTAKRDGLTTAWWKWQASLPQYLANGWQPGMWSGMVCYERPSPLECTDIDLLETIGDVVSDTMLGSMHKKGFLFLLDAILGGITIRLDTTASDCEDCSFSLGRLLTQYHFLKSTKQGEEVKPQANYLPFAVNAVFGSGFIPTRQNTKMRKPVYSIPSFPPLPQVPYAGMEAAMASGFLLHRAGTPVNQLFVMLSQWAGGFVRIKEWQEHCARPIMPDKPLVPGYGAIEDWTSGHPSDTSCAHRELTPFREVHGCSLDEKEATALATDPLASINVAEYLVESTVPQVGLSALPFDVSGHSTAKTYVAKSMLDRMAADMGEYARQVADQRVVQIVGITSADLHRIAVEMDGQGIDASVDRLNQLHARLVALRAKDWSQVQQLVRAIETLANIVPDLSSSDASTDSLTFVLARYAGQRFTVRLEYLTALLLSSQPEKDVHQLNPHLPSAALPDLLRLISTLLLVNNRVGLVDRLVYEIDELRGQLHRLTRKVQAARVAQPLTLARSLSGGTVMQGMPVAPTTDGALDSVSVTSERAATELTELAQQIAVQSSTLAENLLTTRHYTSTSADASAVHSFDPRFLVFEYIFNIMIRRTQFDTIMSFAHAAWKRESKVAQMLMGAGKTSVVGPLLCLMISNKDSLVLTVVPSALLPMSRAMLRSRFSSIVFKKITTFEYDRSTKDDPKYVAKLIYKLTQAKQKQGIVIATAVSVKSMMLKYLELLVALQTTNYDPHAMTALESQQIAMKSVVIDGLSHIMSMWREGVLILDEIDLLLHPLKSELNFPCGNKTSIQPSPSRWQYPMHLLDGFFYAHTGYLSVNAFYELPEAQSILRQLQGALTAGQQQHMLQMQPHLILLNPPYYHSTLKPILAKWSLIWLKAKGVASEVPDAILLEYMTHGWSSEEVSSLVTALLTKAQMILLNLAYNWLNSYLVHCLQKISRVSFGLLRDDEMVDQSLALSRRLLAVPFLALDVPSRSSEFAHVDIQVALTVAAYKIEGLRLSDLRHILSVLKNSLAQEMGPEHARPSAKRFDAFVKEGKRLQKRQRAAKAKADAENALRDGSHQKKKKKQPVQFASSTATGTDGDYKILPLSQFSLTDPSQLHTLYSLVRHLPSILDYYLNSYLFPTCMNHQSFNIAASGQELGNGMLFKCALGFSGTPSDLLPLELGKCAYERGSDGKVLNILTSPTIVSYSIKYDWSVRSLLLDIARANPAYHSLIDTGALITGMDNREVAEFLLDHGLVDMEGVVYLDKHDNQMILLRTGGAPVPASQCGVSPNKRFSYYDQIHTTGIDIRHHVSAVAVMTLGKDMVFRDYAQGAFRMRQIGIGQKIHLFVIPEVLKLIERELKLDAPKSVDGEPASESIMPNGSLSSSRRVENSSLLADLPTHVAAWLTVNAMRTEYVQCLQLSLQNLHTVWRKKAFADLLQDSSTASLSPSLQSRRHLRYDFTHASSFPRVFWLVECINLFKQPIDFTIDDRIPVHKPFFATLKTLLSQHTTFIKDDDQCLAIGAVLTQALEAAGTILPKHSFDAEMINEKEQEQEQQKHQEVLKDPRAQRNEEEHRAWRIEKLKETSMVVQNASGRLIASSQVLPTTASHPFFSLAGFSLEGRPLPLSFPRYLLMSHNYYRQSWALNPTGHRRLKNIYVVAEIVTPKAGPSSVPTGAPSVADATPESLSPSPPTALQTDRWSRLFRMLDADSNGALSTAEELNGLRRLLATMLNEEVPATFFPAECKLTQEQTVRLLRATTKSQDVSKIAGFLAADLTGRQDVAVDLLERTSNEDASRFFAILPLSEAQALRRAVHTTHPLFQQKTSQPNAGGSVQFALWSLDGHLIETTPHYEPVKRDVRASSYQVHLTLQTARFINGELYFSDDELVALLRSISAIHPAHRRTLVDQLLLCRHRDHRTLEKTPLEAILTYTDEAHWLLLYAILITFRARLDAKGLSLLQAFHLFDLDGDGRLDPSELWTAFTFLGFAGDVAAGVGAVEAGAMASPIPPQVTPNDAMDVLRFGDVGQDGALDFDEFVRAFRTREEGHEGERIQPEEEEPTGSDGTDEEESKTEQVATAAASSSLASAASSFHRSSAASSDLPKLELIPIPALQRASPAPAYEKPAAVVAARPSPSPAAAGVAPPQASPPFSSPSPSSAVQPPPAARPMVIATEPWACSICTYINNPGQSRCSMCDTPKAS